MIPENPFEDVDGIRVDKEDSPRILTKADVKIIEELAQGSVIEKELRFLLRTGMRVSEMIHLEVQDVDLDRSIIIVRSHKAKSRKTRYVPIVSKLYDMLHNLKLNANKNKRKLVFVNSLGNQHCLRNILCRFRTILRHAEERGVNVDGVNIHTLRKSYISHMIMSGQDPTKVMKIVGHQSWRLENTSKIFIKSVNFTS
ncbi:tyrosine-type recombinase/integrase [Candidatus Uabimicrobium amorphum]|uniref:Integrase n=1 Tax=Uabimicrobium amorphum TaxID=2596890 RepID=A0A5S9IPV4_UABAM|nr:site-specific integrase [Candidatus Uabimicrobium amorphum]BBM84495.1 integrase [Candidatus Uabimicrobium amorphum]